jgi:NAD-dependent dihydropyrimidine dehydrogenase PreA subunit
VPVIIDYDLCEASGVCESVCPDEVFENQNGRTEVVNAQACSLCWKCVENCSSGAIELD